ncbi:adenylosuccinate synthase [Candidatus Thorarchaeota archaeon]|nr:MAG: adenylosuccinate synthase [Candidatus Thorarchaeota archaeon]
MTNLVVLGLQWGDEGKGKIVDVLAAGYDIVVRFQGGNNAGHTVKIGEETHKFRLIPTGAVRGKRAVIGNGVVVDPRTLVEEIRHLKKTGIAVNLLLSNRAHIITPYHVKIDELQERQRGDSKIGTTKRGIGPTYSNKIDRLGLRVADFLPSPRDTVAHFQEVILARQNALFGVEDSEELRTQFEECISLMQSLDPYVGDTGEYLRQAIQRGELVLFEGAQGTLLDIDHGTYPYVTSSNCSAGGVSVGTGVPPSRVGPVLGVAKAYVTRVGAGPFPTELTDDVGQKIQTKGKEFGTVTGRPRRCGWLDLVALRYAVMLNDARYLAVTKLDVLSDIGPLKVCTGYELDGLQISSIPAHVNDYEEVQPVYEDIDGWNAPNGGDWAEVLRAGPEALPKGLNEYLEKIERFTEAEVKLISLGPGREETMALDENWLAMD